MDHVEVGGLRIAFERVGAGPPLILLHGFAGDHREWSHQIEDLSHDFTVVAWDAPGSGGSSDPPESFRMPDYADLVVGLVDSLGLGQPHVAGLSFGATLSLETYRRHPRVPRSLVLASAYAGWAGSLPPDVTEERLRRSLLAADLPPTRFAFEMIPSLFPGSATKEIVDELAMIAADFHPAGFRTMSRSLAEADLRDVLARIRVATLLLYGDADVRAPLHVAETLHAAIPASTLSVIPGVGHMCNMEASERFNQEVRAFLQSVERASDRPSIA